MARVDIRTQLDMLNAYVWYGHVDGYSSRHITISAGDQSATYLGSFSYDVYGNVYGRVTGLESSYAGDLQFKFSGANLDAYWLFEVFYGDLEDILGAIFSADDLMFGAAAADALRGYTGNDQLFGGGGNDHLLGDSGNDRLQGDGGNDRLDGGAGIDTAVYAGTPAVHVNLAIAGPQNTGHGQDTLIGIENVVSGSGADVLRGNAVANTFVGQAGNDQLYGGDGNDRLQGDAGNDRLDGGAGIDTVVYTGTVAARVDLGVLASQNTGHGWDTLASIENAFAGTGNDVLRGNPVANMLVGNGGNDHLWGAAGNDHLQGGVGQDWLDGSLGNDRLVGGAGADRFVFQRGCGADTLVDFENGSDKFLIASGAERFGEIFVSDSGANATIRFADVIVTVENIDHRLIDASDFVFV